MSATEELLNQVLALPKQERAAMARQILLSLGSAEGDADCDAAWAAEIEARLDAMDRGDSVALDWRETVDEIRSQLPLRQSQ